MYMRAFIAIDIPEELKRKAELLENGFRMEGIALVHKDSMHITLQFLGEIDAAQAEKVIAAIKSCATKPFRLTLSEVSYFTPRLIRVIFADITEGRDALQRLYSKLDSALTARSIVFEKEHGYAPHLTLARVRRVKDMRALRQALELNAKAELGSFEVRSIVLKESVLTPEGHTYRDLYVLAL